MSVSGGPSSAGNRVQVSGPCTAGPSPRHCSDQSLACVAGADVGGSGSREWKRRTRAGKAQGGAPPLPPRPSRRGGRGRACSLGGFRCRRRYKGRGRACALPARRPSTAGPLRRGVCSTCAPPQPLPAPRWLSSALVTASSLLLYFWLPFLATLSCKEL